MVDGTSHEVAVASILNFAMQSVVKNNNKRRNTKSNNN